MFCWLVALFFTVDGAECVAQALHIQCFANVVVLFNVFYENSDSKKIIGIELLWCAGGQ